MSSPKRTRVSYPANRCAASLASFAARPAERAKYTAASDSTVPAQVTTIPAH